MARRFTKNKPEVLEPIVLSLVSNSSASDVALNGASNGAPVFITDVMIVNKNRSILFSEEINIDINGEISFDENSVLTEVS